MYIISEIFTASLEIKKSKFIAFLCHFNEFNLLHERLKNEHKKANHIVWAYRYYNEFMQVCENSSDDGEPKGSSAPALLAVLRGAELIDCGILVVRYFGGIKLGVGGLVRAYGNSAKSVLDVANLIEYKHKYKFFVSFSLLSRFKHFFEKSNFIFNMNFNDEGAIFECNLNDSELLEFQNFSNEYKQSDNFKLM